MNLLVSACLLGVNCRYDGGCRTDRTVTRLAGRFGLVPVCPEQMGGLPTPRPPVELCEGRAVTRQGLDVTDRFLRGAQEALKLARLCGCRYAVLKSKSPSCGCGLRYDGTFSGGLTSGDGLTAELLRRSGIVVLHENEAEAELRRLFPDG